MRNCNLSFLVIQQSVFVLQATLGFFFLLGFILWLICLKLLYSISNTTQSAISRLFCAICACKLCVDCPWDFITDSICSSVNPNALNSSLFHNLPPMSALRIFYGVTPPNDPAVCYAHGCCEIKLIFYMKKGNRFTRLPLFQLVIYFLLFLLDKEFPFFPYFHCELVQGH